jgi:hypothetical protein
MEYKWLPEMWSYSLFYYLSCISARSSEEALISHAFRFYPLSPTLLFQPLRKPKINIKIYWQPKKTDLRRVTLSHPVSHANDSEGRK